MVCEGAPVTRERTFVTHKCVPVVHELVLVSASLHIRDAQVCAACGARACACKRKSAPVVVERTPATGKCHWCACVCLRCAGVRLWCAIVVRGCAVVEHGSVPVVRGCAPMVHECARVVREFVSMVGVGMCL